MAAVDTKEPKTLPRGLGECSLCKGDYRTPRLLPCQHTFCTPCLKTHIVDGEAPQFLCPTCDLEVVLSSGGVESLPENYVYSIMADKVNLPHLTRTCISCEIQGKDETAHFQCLDCGDAFCTQCQGFHMLSSLTRHHRLVSVKELEDGKFKQTLTAIKSVFCEKHSRGTRQLPLKIYCRKCETLHCEDCILDENENVLISSDNWHSLYKENLQDFVKEVDLLLKNLKEQKEIVGVIQRVEGRILEKRATIENQIYDKATEIQELVEKVKSDKLLLVQEHFDKELEKCTELLEEEGKCLKRLESTVTFVQNFMKYSTEREYLMHEENVKTRMADFMIEREKFEVKTQDLILLGKPAEEMEQSLSEVVGLLDSTYKCTNITGKERGMELVVKGKIKLNVEAHGIAVAENGDIVVVGKSKIEILNKDGESKNVILCEKLGNAWAVAVKNDLIFVTDNFMKLKRLLVLDLNGNCRTAIRMPDSEQNWDFTRGVGVAVGDGGIIFVCAERTSAIYTCTLEDTKLQQFTSKKQQPGLALPHNLSITLLGHLVVSMCESTNIHVYNQKAELQWQFKNEDRSFGLCCDLNNHIFIGSYGNNKLHLINEDGELKGTMQIPGVGISRGLALSKEGELLVCHKTKEITKVSLWG